MTKYYIYTWSGTVLLWQHVNSTLSHIAQHAVTKHPATEQNAILHNADYKNKNNSNCCAGFLCLKIARSPSCRPKSLLCRDLKKTNKKKAWKRWQMGMMCLHRAQHDQRRLHALCLCLSILPVLPCDTISAVPRCPVHFVSTPRYVCTLFVFLHAFLSISS